VVAAAFKLRKLSQALACDYHSIFTKKRKLTGYKSGEKEKRKPGSVTVKKLLSLQW